MKPKANASRSGWVAWAALLVMWIGAPPSQADQESYRFPYPANRLGWADGSGKLSIWVDDDWKVDLGNGESLPLRFHFSSMQDRVGDGMLGAGWWVPLLESTVVQLGETMIRMTSLGGQSIYLYAVPERNGEYRSRDRKWNGVLRGQSAFDVEGPGGWKYAYKSGSLATLKSQSGKVLNWDYGPTRHVRSIGLEGVGQLIGVRLGRNGKLQGIDVGDSQRFDFEHSEFPVLVITEGFAGVVKVVPSVGRILQSDTSGEIQNEISIEVKAAREGHYQCQFSFLNASESEIVEEFNWASDGILSGNSGNRYRYELGEGVTVMKLSDDKGHVESYSWDSRRLIEDRTLGSVTTRRHFIGTEGINSMRVRKVEKIDTGNNGANSEEHFSWSDSGELIAQWNDKWIVRFDREDSETTVLSLKGREIGGVITNSIKKMSGPSDQKSR